MTVIFNFTRQYFYALIIQGATLVNLTLVIQMYKSSNTCQKVLLLPNFDASVFDDFFYYNISHSNSTSRGGYTFP